MTFTITTAIIAITCLVSLASFNSHRAVDALSLWPARIRERREYYRFITSGFVHGDIAHLAFNMFTLYFFGKIAEQMFPPMYYIGFYLAALIVSDIPSYFKHRYTYGYRSIGASGAVSAIVFASVLPDPWATFGIFGIIPMPAVVYAFLYITYCIYASRRNIGNINHDAHLWGGLFGWVFTLLIYPFYFQYFLRQLAHPHFVF